MCRQVRGSGLVGEGQRLEVHEGSAGAAGGATHRSARRPQVCEVQFPIMDGRSPWVLLQQVRLSFPALDQPQLKLPGPYAGRAATLPGEGAGRSAGFSSHTRHRGSGHEAAGRSPS
jgi:hypothetical protein